jgi:hypothetical protein
MRGIQGFGDLTDKINSPLRRDPADGVEQHVNVGTVHQAHVDEELVLDLAEVMNGDDVRVPQPRSDVRFALESLEVRGVIRERFGQELEGDVPATGCVVRLINVPHSAGTQQSLEVIVSDPLACGHENRPPKSLRQASAPQTLEHAWKSVSLGHGEHNTLWSDA